MIRITPQLRWAFAQWNIRNIQARAAYARDPNSTHNQPKGNTRRSQR